VIKTLVLSSCLFLISSHRSMYDRDRHVPFPRRLQRVPPPSPLPPLSSISSLHLNLNSPSTSTSTTTTSASSPSLNTQLQRLLTRSRGQDGPIIEQAPLSLHHSTRSPPLCFSPPRDSLTCPSCLQNSSEEHGSISTRPHSNYLPTLREPTRFSSSRLDPLLSSPISRFDFLRSNRFRISATR